MLGKSPTKLEVDHSCLLGSKASNQTNKSIESFTKDLHSIMGDNSSMEKYVSAIFL